jgi:hypothetical protein
MRHGSSTVDTGEPVRSARDRVVLGTSYDRPNARSQIETVMTETAFRTFGGLLGLVGVLLVAYELDAAIGQYSPMHSAVRRTARRLRRLWGWLMTTYRRLVGQQPEPTVVGASSIA